MLYPVNQNSGQMPLCYGLKKTNHTKMKSLTPRCRVPLSRVDSESRFKSPIATPGPHLISSTVTRGLGRLPYGNTLHTLARACGEPKLLSLPGIRADNTVAHLSPSDRKQSTWPGWATREWDWERRGCRAGAEVPGRWAAPLAADKPPRPQTASRRRGVASRSRCPR